MVSDQQPNVNESPMNATRRLAAGRSEGHLAPAHAEGIRVDGNLLALDPGGQAQVGAKPVRAGPVGIGLEQRERGARQRPGALEAPLVRPQDGLRGGERQHGAGHHQDRRAAHGPTILRSRPAR